MMKVSKIEQTMKFKRLFEEQRDALAATNKYLIEEFSLNIEDRSDEVDLTSAELEQDMRMRLRSRETLFLKKINASLAKIKAGTFGICESCEEDIELQRLEVRPTATLCICCKESEEIAESRSADGLKPKSMGKSSQLRTA